MSDDKGSEISGLGQICITVRDLDRCRGFYRDTLGLKHLFDAPGMAFFDLGGVRLMMGTAEKPELLHPASILYYRVDDIRAAAQRLKGRGVHVESEPRAVHKDARHELWLAFFRDPEENLLALMSEVTVA
jgi:methylmalonyl-CoA/ethylmalonyl-CoA epimerase